MYILSNGIILENKAYETIVEELVGSGLTISQFIIEHLAIDNT